jgi:hypothetical protein
MDWSERRLFSILYIGQIVELKLDQREARNVKIRSGFIKERLSPYLFDMYSQLCIKEALERFEYLITGHVFHTVKYEDELLCYWLRKRRHYRLGLID